VVRDMWERAMTFGEYVAFYGLTRSEGALLRYLSDAYRALRSSVPDHARTEALDDVIEWLGETVRQTDSSLLDEWEQLVSGAPAPADEPVASRAPLSFSANERAFTIAVRNALFRRVELAALRRVGDLSELDPDVDWAAALSEYFAEYDRIGTDADARSAALFHTGQRPASAASRPDADAEAASGTGPRTWSVRQVFDDPDGDHDWAISATVDLDASDAAGEPVVVVTAVGPLN